MSDVVARAFTALVLVAFFGLVAFGLWLLYGNGDGE